VTEPLQEGPRTTGPSRRPLVALGTVVALLALVAVALAAVLLSRLADRSALDEAREDALRAGRQAVVNLDSISAATVDRDMDRVVAAATGTFKEQFSRSREDLKQAIVANATESSGRVISAGVVSADEASATLLVAADRTIKDRTNPEAQVVHDRWRVYLEKRDGKWLVEKLDPVG